MDKILEIMIVVLKISGTVLFLSCISYALLLIWTE